MDENLEIIKNLNRLVKLSIDVGEASSLEEANKIFSGYRLGIFIGKEEVNSPAYHAAILTAVNTARRCFLGGVYVFGEVNVPLLVKWKNHRTLAGAIDDLQGKIVTDIGYDLPIINFSNEMSISNETEFSIRPIIHGWNGGIIPCRDYEPILSNEIFTPAGVLAGAIAISEAFQQIRGDSCIVGHRSVGMSLWEPSTNGNWLQSDPGPSLEVLPSKLWLIGLGHLGQAYLWTLGFLPYPKDSKVQLVLQDFDKLEIANDSTSLLTNSSIIGKMKTRAMADWCEDRGFTPMILERKFSGDFAINSDEPALALGGVDNIAARRDLDKVGFKLIIDAGLGKGTQEYLGFKINTFPSSRSADQCWKPKQDTKDTDNPYQNIIQQPVYEQLLNQGMDGCGLVELAGKSVGASFVGAITSALVIAQVLRFVQGSDVDEVINGDLRASKIFNTVIKNPKTPPLFNPGLIKVN